MNNLCVYCQQILYNNEIEICLSCKEKLLDRDLKELERYEQQGIADTFYVSIKIDDYFQVHEKLPDFDALQFHKRRVACINECIGLIEKSVFLPRTAEEVETFRETVKQFWAGGLTETQRDLRTKEFIKEGYYCKASSVEYTAKVILASLMADKERLNWSWWQHMEIHFSVLDKYVEKGKLLSIVEKHFANEIQSFFDLTDYYKEDE